MSQPRYQVPEPSEEKVPNRPKLAFVHSGKNNVNQGQRTFRMFEQINKNDWEVKVDDEQQAILANKYIIVTSETHKFYTTKKPLASIGTDLSREIILLDPNSNTLKVFIQTLTEHITQQAKQQNRDLTTVEILNLTLQFVKKTFGGNQYQEDEDEIDHLIEEEGTKVSKYKGSPIIEIDFFIKNQIGLCRHRALLGILACDYLRTKGFLPNCKFYHHRQDLKKEGHTWVMCHDELTDDLFMFDSGNNQAVINLRNHTERTASFWNEELFTTAEQRYGHGKNYTELVSEEDKLRYLNSLLEQAPSRRLVYLNYHQGDLAAISKDLQDSKQNAIYKNHKNYTSLLAEIKRIQNTKQIHATHYNQLASIEDKQQFILGLLLKNPLEIETILKNQTTADLEAIETELKNPKTAFLYKQFKNYKTLTTDIISNTIEKMNLIKILFNLILNTIASGQLELESGGCCFFSKPGKKIKVGNKSVRIPKPIFPIFEAILKTKTEDVSLEELNQLLKKVNQIAQKIKAQDLSPIYDILSLSDVNQMTNRLGVLTGYDANLLKTNSANFSLI